MPTVGTFLPESSELCTVCLPTTKDGMRHAVPTTATETDDAKNETLSRCMGRAVRRGTIRFKLAPYRGVQRRNTTGMRFLGGQIQCALALRRDARIAPEIGLEARWDAGPPGCLFQGRTGI